jgi:hypothetical protein
MVITYKPTKMSINYFNSNFLKILENMPVTSPTTIIISFNVNMSIKSFESMTLQNTMKKCNVKSILSEPMIAYYDSQIDHV